MSGTRLLTIDELRARFPWASRSVLLSHAAALEGQARVDAEREAAPAHAPVDTEAPKRKAAIKRRKKMNKTEVQYARILEAMKARGEIARWQFEGVAFRWAETEEAPPMLFSPDFAVFDALGLKLIEVKGAHIWTKDGIRFKGCRADWPEFRWELWQLKSGDWTRIL